MRNWLRGALAALALGALVGAPVFGQGGDGGAWGEADAGGAACRTGMHPLIKAATGAHACASPESKAVLIERGWGADPAAMQGAPAASDSHTAASDSHTAASDSHTAASDSHTAASDSHTAASDSHTAASDSHTAASDSHTAASDSHTAASDSHTAASDSHTAASDSHTAASDSHTAASDSHTAASDSHTAASARLAPLASLAADEKAWLEENPVIYVAYEDRPPIEHASDDGRLLGLSGMYIDHFEEFTGADFRPVPVGNRAGFARAFLDGEAYMALALTDASLLYHHAHILESHTTLMWDMVALDDTVDDNDLELDLGALHERNFTIGTIRGHEIEAWIDMHYPQIPYMSIDTHERAFDALESGRIHILFEAWAVADHIASSRGIDNLSHLGSVGPEMQLSIALSKNHPELGGIVKKALATMPDDVRNVRTAEIVGELPSASRRLKTAGPPGDIGHALLDAGPAPQGAAVAAAAADTAAGPQFSDTERAWLDANPVVHFVYMDWPPIEYTGDDGRVTGLSAMYAERLEAFTGIKFVGMPVDSWSTAFSLVAGSDPYVSLSVTPNTHSFGHLVFTAPHSTIDLNMVTKGPLDISPADLGNFRVGTIRGSAIESQLDSYGGQIDYVSIDTHTHALEALDAGRIDVLLEYWPVAERLAAEAGIAGLHNSGKMDFEVILSAGVSKQNPLLNDILSKVIYSIPVEERAGMLAAALGAGLPH